MNDLVPRGSLELAPEVLWAESGSGLKRDRDAEDTYPPMVEFSTHDEGMENSNRLETGKFAAVLAGICDGHLAFRNLDVLREEEL
jgi:hypothetical protein